MIEYYCMVNENPLKVRSIMETEKDDIAIDELETIIRRLNGLWEDAKGNRGKMRPIISASEIELVKDHLDLIVKYTKI